MRQFIGRLIPVAVYSSKLKAFAVVFLMTVVLQAQDQEQPQVAPAQATSSPTVDLENPVETPDSEAATTEEKKRKASIALLAVGGIAIVGVGIIAATMIWARRLRRLARNNGPPQRTTGNDFWFLRPRKYSTSESPIKTQSPPSSSDRRDDQS